VGRERTPRDENDRKPGEDGKEPGAEDERLAARYRVGNYDALRDAEHQVQAYQGLPEPQRPTHIRRKGDLRPSPPLEPRTTAHSPAGAEEPGWRSSEDLSERYNAYEELLRNKGLSPDDMKRALADFSERLEVEQKVNAKREQESDAHEEEDERYRYVAGSKDTRIPEPVRRERDNADDADNQGEMTDRRAERRSRRDESEKGSKASDQDPDKDRPQGDRGSGDRSR
jgi:hypothetical protein